MEEVPTESASSRFDLRIAKAAAERYGVVPYAQLVKLGANSAAITLRLRAGRLHRLHRGVYSVVPPKLLTIEGRWLAAVLTCGAGAVLSHRSAAALWEIAPIPSGPIDVTVHTTNGRRQRPGLRIHRSYLLSPELTTRHRGIPVTTPARTIADLRRTLGPDAVTVVLRRAEIRRLDVGAQPGYRDDRTASAPERLFLGLCRRYGLPEPEVNVWLDPYRADFLWRKERVIVEVDSFRYHGTHSAFESDRERSGRLKARGYEVLQFSDLQVEHAHAWVAPTVRAVLDERRALARWAAAGAETAAR
jgi:hypothetical protein